MYYIYKLTNRINGKGYVGVTNNYEKRMREHSYASNDYAISRAIRKHGWDSFNHEIIAQTECHVNAYRVLEPKYIAEHDTKDSGYNLTDGGEGTLGYSPSSDARNKMSEAKKGKTLSEDHKRKISESNMGRKVHDETKQKISAKLKGNKNFEGKSHSNCTKSILSKQKAKTWDVVDPDGNHITVTNMRKFCLDNNLHHSAMSRVMSGKQKKHKGYTRR